MMKVLCNLFCGSSDSDASTVKLREVLREDGIGIVSASCCAPMAAEQDDALKNNIDAAIKVCGRKDSWAIISITDAQKTLPKLEAQMHSAEQRLVSQIQSLVAAQGFSVFPILIVDRKIVFYGGLPTTDMIVEKLDPERMVS